MSRTMPTEHVTSSAFLTLAQWFSPSYPLGSFAYSHGLETAIQSGAVTTAADLQGWLADLIEHGSVRNDVILLRLAYGAETSEERAEVDAATRAFAASSERLLEADLQGSAFARTTSAIWGTEAPNLTNPVAVGAAARGLNLPEELTALMYAQAFVSNLVSAAVRLVPLGQTEGQTTLAALSPRCVGIVEATVGTTLDDLSSTTFAFDIAAMRHETLQTRIFRS
jgi:urease accessory protein